MIEPRNYKEGDLVLKKILSSKEDPLEKFKPNFQGPYIVTKVLYRGALCLSEIDEESLSELVNSDSVKRYFV